MDFGGQSAEQRLEQRVKSLEYEIKILKNEIQKTLLEIQEQVLVHYYPDLRAPDEESDEGVRQAYDSARRKQGKQVASRPAAAPRASAGSSDSDDEDDDEAEAPAVSPRSAAPPSRPAAAPQPSNEQQAEQSSSAPGFDLNQGALTEEAAIPGVRPVSLREVRAGGLGDHKREVEIGEMQEEEPEPELPDITPQEQVMALSGFITRLVLVIGAERVSALVEAAAQQAWLIPETVIALHRVIGFVNAEEVPDSVPADDLVQAVKELARLLNRPTTDDEARWLVEEADLG